LIRDPFNNIDSLTSVAFFLLDLVSDGAGHWFVINRI
jgi:hypothetical protein